MYFVAHHIVKGYQKSSILKIIFKYKLWFMIFYFPTGLNYFSNATFLMGPNIML